jgi:phage terminase Nu1 subunit (DNA packaging protein)
MKLISISECADLTGRDRRTIKKAASGLQSSAGPGNAVLYRSDELLQRLYIGGDGPTYAEALRKLAIAREKVAQAQAKDAELQLAEKSGELVRADDMMRYLENFATLPSPQSSACRSPKKNGFPFTSACRMR